MPGRVPLIQAVLKGLLVTRQAMRYVGDMRYCSILSLLTISFPLVAQTHLEQRIASIAQEAHGQVFVACSLPGVPLDCSLNPHGHPPMQSTFKLPLAIAVFQQVERGKLSLDQPIRFLPSDRYPGTYSPLQEAHPGANLDVSLRDLLQLSVGQSDNTATDILLRVLGGPQAVQESLNQLGLGNIHVRDSERSLHDDFQAQYRNDAEPMAMVALLRLLAGHTLLNAEHTALLNRWMTESTTGQNRIKGLLPTGTLVAHKTGSSGERNGLAPASNDVGLITLPNSQRLALAIFVSNARAGEATRDSVIARIAKAIYDQALARP